MSKTVGQVWQCLNDVYFENLRDINKAYNYEPMQLTIDAFNELYNVKYSYVICTTIVFLERETYVLKKLM